MLHIIINMWKIRTFAIFDLVWWIQNNIYYNTTVRCRKPVWYIFFFIRPGNSDNSWGTVIIAQMINYIVAWGSCLFYEYNSFPTVWLLFLSGKTVSRLKIIIEKVISSRVTRLTGKRNRQLVPFKPFLFSTSLFPSDIVDNE